MSREPVILWPDRPVPAAVLRAWELLAPRYPRAVNRLLARLMLRVPRGSRLRRWLLLAAATIALDVTARTRLDLVLPIWDPDCEWHWDKTFRSLGFDEVYRGHDGVRRSLEAWNEIWSDRSFTLRKVLDGGNTWITHTIASGRGITSGVPAQADAFSVIRLDPLIVDFRNFADEDAALREAGFVVDGLRKQQS